MRYAHLFWKLLGVPAHGWDGLLLADLPWMKKVCDAYENQQKEAARG